MIVGNLFLMNLFLAILLKNFEEQKQSNKDEIKEEIENEVEAFSINKSISFAFKSLEVKFKRVAFRNRDPV